LEMLVICGGVLDAIPLSGVVSPFLSSGNTAMLANFLVFAILVNNSNSSPLLSRDRKGAVRPFLLPTRVTGAVLATCAFALVGKAAYYQFLHDQEFLIDESGGIAEDGG